MGQVLVVTSEDLIVLNLVIFLALSFVADLLIFLQLLKGTLFLLSHLFLCSYMISHSIFFSWSSTGTFFHVLYLIFVKQGYILTSEIDGTIQMKSYLTGNPEIRLALNEDLSIGRTGSSSYGMTICFSFDMYVLYSLMYSVHMT